jgi:formyl-CoA transferase
MLPMQSVDLAVDEMRYAREKLGMRGGFLRPNPYHGKKMISDPMYEPFWTMAEELDFSIGFHEGSTNAMPTVGVDRFEEDRAARHMISHTMEMMLVALSVIWGGVADRHPRLRVAFLESGGGWIAPWLDRMDRHFDDQGFNESAPKTRPSELFQRNCWISFEPVEQHRGAPTTSARTISHRLSHQDGFFLAPSDQAPARAVGEQARDPRGALRFYADRDRGALAGIRILDLTQFEAGTSCTQLLGLLGADVIKVEPRGGEQSRRNRPEVPGLDAMFFLLFNANSAASPSTKKPEGTRSSSGRARTWWRTSRSAHGAARPINMAPAVNLRIILARLKGFGLRPVSRVQELRHDRPAMGGTSVTGFGSAPVPAGEHRHSGAGVHMAAGIMAAIIERTRTGKGQVVEVSMQEAVANLIRQRYVVHYRDNKPTPRRGNGAPPGAVPDGLYACTPGGPNDYVYIYVQPMNQGMWQTSPARSARICSRPALRGRGDQMGHRDALNGIARAWTTARAKQEVLETLGKAGVPCGAILDTQEVLDDPHMNARGAIETIEHATRGRFRVPGCPIRLSSSEPVTTPPPLAGQHTGEVLAEVLGLSAAAPRRSRARGAARSVRVLRPPAALGRQVPRPLGCAAPGSPRPRRDSSSAEARRRSAARRPGAHDLAEDRELADVVGVVLGDDQELADVGVLGRIGQRRAQRHAGIARDLLERGAVAPERGHRLLPGLRVGLRVLVRPVVVRPRWQAVGLVLDVVEDVALGDPQCARADATACGRSAPGC